MKGYAGVDLNIKNVTRVQQFQKLMPKHSQPRELVYLDFLFLFF